MSKRASINTAALKTIIIYFIVGILWILFSDTILDSIVKNQIILTELQILKGWFFICITALLLYFLIKRYTERMKDSLVEKQIIEKHLDYFTKYSNDIILLLNDSGNILEVNEKAVQVYGFSKQHLLENNYSNLVQDKKELFSKQQLEKLKTEGGLLFESIHLRSNSPPFPVEVSAKPIELDEKLFLQCIITDITERKKAEEQISILSRVVEQSPSSIIITDTSGKIEYVNPSFTRLTGYVFEEVIGKNPNILKSNENPDRMYKDLWSTITTGKEWRNEIINKKKDGTLYWEYTLISPLRDKRNKITHFIAIKEDITGQKEMTEELIRAKEKAENSDRLKSEFLAQMSHEIRTPLNVILSYNSLLNEELKDNVEEDLKESFASIDKAGKRLLRTLNHILNMAAVQSGNFEVSLETVEISNIIEHFLKEFNHSARVKKLELNYNKLTEDTKIKSDEYILAEIFQNLLDNAIKYTSAGSISIEVARNENSQLYIKVKDTGIGISDEYLPRLFHPFSQEESGYSRKFEGNGLGLALVKNYVRFIGADIIVTSKKGVGTEFTVVFPKE